MNFDKETLAKWKEDAEKATQNWKKYRLSEFYSQADDQHISRHIANACPQNFLMLIEKLEKYEEGLKFYATKEHIDKEYIIDERGNEKSIYVVLDRGQHARKALDGRE